MYAARAGTVTPAADSTAWQKARAWPTVESPEMRSASLTPSAGRAPLEELLRALVREVQPLLQVDDRLADRAEAEVAGFDDARVHGADRDLVHAGPLDLSERETAARRLRTTACSASRRSGK